MRLPLALAVVAVLLAAPAAEARIVPGKGMAGVRIGMTEAQVQSVLGAPASRRIVSDDFGPSLRLRYTSRGGLRMILRRNADNEYELFQLLTRGTVERTKQGIGVGSTERRLRRRLKGEACETISGFRSCTIGSFEVGEIVTDFRIRRRRVTSVVVGRVVD